MNFQSIALIILALPFLVHEELVPHSLSIFFFLLQTWVTINEIVFYIIVNLIFFFCHRLYLYFIYLFCEFDFKVTVKDLTEL